MLVASLVPCLWLAPVAADPSNSPRPTVGKKFAKPSQKREFIALTGPEIRRVLIGKRIAQDRTVDWMPNKTAVGFSEEFFPDGRWTSNRSMRGVIVVTGIWWIYGNKICTRATHYQNGAEIERQSECRQVWREKASGGIAISEKRDREVVVIISSLPVE
jgi:hypothetical protein